MLGGGVSGGRGPDRAGKGNRPPHERLAVGQPDLHPCSAGFVGARLNGGQPGRVDQRDAGQVDVDQDRPGRRRGADQGMQELIGMVTVNLAGDP